MVQTAVPTAVQTLPAHLFGRAPGALGTMRAMRGDPGAANAAPGGPPEVEPHPTDRIVATRLASRDPDALAEVYARFGSLALGVARRVVRDEVLAEDVAQEVFTYLWEHPERFDPSRGTLKAWVGLLAYRRGVDRVRAESRRTRTEAAAHTALPTATTADDALDTEWICARVRRALDSLPEEQRQALVSAYFGDRTYRQVAVALGIPEGTAKSRIRLALTRLHDLLGDGASEEGSPAWT